MLTGFQRALPSDANGVWLLTLSLLLLYFLTSWTAHALQRSPKGVFEHCLSAAGFANGIVLVLSTLSDDMFRSIASIKVNLAVAGIAMAASALKALKK